MAGLCDAAIASEGSGEFRGQSAYDAGQLDRLLSLSWCVPAIFMIVADTQTQSDHSIAVSGIKYGSALILRIERVARSNPRHRFDTVRYAADFVIAASQTSMA